MDHGVKRPVQLAERASWIERPIQLARSACWNERAVQLVERASWIDHTFQLVRSASWNERTVQLTRSASRTNSSCLGPDLVPFHRASTDQSLVSYRSELPLKLYNKNRKDSFSSMKSMVIV
ncbi:hypothetical protein F2Q68_00039308 [Brassica cretica]|uniref:Uncharacterized protein n=1 Tax=Brassica cretica TaxID=69181 RepID=A0A8S9MS22_BRACR|nr:hypothetical protein F2Q68_00039308 [Brassica cretica]